MKLILRNSLSDIYKITPLITKRSTNSNNGVIKCEYLFFTKELNLYNGDNYNWIKYCSYDQSNLRIILKTQLFLTYKFPQDLLCFS